MILSLLIHQSAVFAPDGEEEVIPRLFDKAYHHGEFRKNESTMMSLNRMLALVVTVYIEDKEEFNPCDIRIVENPQHEENHKSITCLSYDDLMKGVHARRHAIFSELKEDDPSQTREVPSLDSTKEAP